MLICVERIMSCVSSVSYPVLFNGGKLEEFKPSRGLRQGDPISPYLFLLAAEGLSCILKGRNIIDDVAGIKVAPTAPCINHLPFADDSILFVKANEVGAQQIKDSLDIYCQASGQRINMDKSSIFFGKGCSDATRGQIKGLLGVQNESLAEKYLGLPSSVGRSKNGVFKYLKDRVWARVRGWMEKALSCGGKEILIKSVPWHVSHYPGVFASI